MTKVLPLYFGCYEISGHYVFDKNMNSVSRGDPNARYLNSNDGKLPPQNIDQKEGVYRWKLIGDKTIISFWDRSVDDRFGSHSDFILEGRLKRPEAIEAIKLNFPKIVERFNFDLVWEGEALGDDPNN